MTSRKPKATPEPAPAVFLSYRRADTAGHAGRLRDGLRTRLRGGLFRDIDGIGGGQDFVQAIDEAVAQCKVLLVLIGDQWLSIPGADGRRRLDDPEDFVRREIVAALGRGVTILPVLVEGARMPGEKDLPDDLKSLSRRNALELSETRWEYDVDQLVKALGQHVEVCAAVEEGGLAGMAKGFAANKVALALVAVSALAAAGFAGKLLLSVRDTKGAAAAAPAAATASPGPAPADSKKQEELKLARDLAWGVISTGDEVLTVVNAGYYPPPGKQRDAMNEQTDRLAKSLNAAWDIWKKEQPRLDDMGRKYTAENDSLKGLQESVEAYKVCVEDITSAFIKKEKERIASLNKCTRERQKTKEAYDKLNSAI